MTGRGCRGCCATAPGSAASRRRRLVETGHVVDVLAVAGDTERTRQRVVHQTVDGDEAQAAGTGPGAHLLGADQLAIAVGASRQQAQDVFARDDRERERSEEHTSELQPLMRNSYDDFCLKKK